MTLRGLPDWHEPLLAGVAFAAHEQPGVSFVVPTALEPRPGGLVVDRFAQDRGSGGGIARWGVLTLAWEAVIGAHTTVPAPRPLPFDGGLVRLTGPDVLRGPDGGPALGGTHRLDQSGVATFVAALDLDDQSTDLVLEAHGRGTALVGADVVLVARGVAARHRGVVEVDLARLGAALAPDAEGALDVEGLRERLSAPEALGIRFVAGGPADEVARAEAADALLDRLVARLGAPVAPPARDPAALVLGARIPARVRFEVPAAGTLRWELDQPLLAPRLFTLASAPLQPDAPPAQVRQHVAPALASGHHRVVVATTAAPPWVGGFLGYELEVPPNPPDRPQRIRVGALFDGAPTSSRDLRLSPTEPLAGTVAGTVVFDSGEQVSGAPRPLVPGTQLLRTDAFAAQFLPLELSPDLAGCEVTVEWFPGTVGADATPSAVAALGDGAPRATLLAPRAEAATLRVGAVAPDGRIAVSEPMPAVPLVVDPFVFPGTGAQSVAIEVDFAAGSPDTCTLELLPDGREEPEVRHFARGRPAGVWSRFVASPFATGYRWRVAGTGEWAQGGATLRVPAGGTPGREEGEDMSEPEVRLAGLRLFPTTNVAGGREWLFVPEAPAIATEPGGAAAASLLEAGGQHLLTLTGRLTATEEQHVRAREELAVRDGVAPAAVVLRPATLGDPRASVTLVVDGAATELAESTTSGIWPYNAVFQVRLDARQAEAVRRAWAGERGLLGLHYEGELRRGEAEPRISTASSSSSSVSTTSTTTTTNGGGAVSVTSTTSHSETGGLDVAARPEAAIRLVLDLDGADWLPQLHG